jgi:hypothetical protein
VTAVTVRLAKGAIHLTGPDGFPFVIPEGARIPAEYEARVTNPRAYEEVEVEAEALTPGPAEPTSPAAPSAPAGGEDDGSTPPPPPAADYDPSTEDEADKPYREREYRSLQSAAKARDLSGQGSGDVLIARLEADDRDRAANAE